MSTQSNSLLPCAAVSSVVTPPTVEGFHNPFLEDLHSPNHFIATDVDGAPLSPLQRLASGLPFPIASRRGEEWDYHEEEVFDSVPSGLAARKSIFVKRLQLGEANNNNTSPSSDHSPCYGGESSSECYQRRLDVVGGFLRTPDASLCGVPATLVPQVVTQFTGCDVMCPDGDGVVREWVCSRCHESCLPRAMFCHGCGTELWIANM